MLEFVQQQALGIIPSEDGRVHWPTGSRMPVQRGQPLLRRLRVPWLGCVRLTLLALPTLTGRSWPIVQALWFGVVPRQSGTGGKSRKGLKQKGPKPCGRSLTGLPGAADLVSHSPAASQAF